MGEKRVLATGSWLYDGTVDKPVFIVRLDYDFWYELARADGTLEPGETPISTNDGFWYYVSFHGIKTDGSFWPDSGAYLSLREAKADVERRLPSVVRWR